MRSDVSIIFDSRHSLDVSVHVEPSREAAMTARDWFDSAWEMLGCEPLRPSGKVLLLDKMMGVADALGYERLASDAKEWHEFAQQAALALEKPRIIVDLPGLSVAH